MGKAVFDFFCGLFPEILNMSVTAGIVILAVLLLRLCLKEAPKIFSYLLWSVVLFRLLCPVSLSAPFSLLNMVNATVTENGTLEYLSPILAQDSLPVNIAPVPGAEGVKEDGRHPIDAPAQQPGEQSDKYPAQQPGEQPELSQQDTVSQRGDSSQSLPKRDSLERSGKNRTLFLTGVFAMVWLMGMGVLAVYSLISLILLRRKTACSVRLRDNIYLADNISSPFVFGLVCPKIYLPSFLEKEEREYIILHEKHHIRRGDHAVKLLAFAALCLHWFNPLVWLAFILAGKDMEMSCDEAVMRRMDRDIRAEYSASLLHLSTGRRILAGYPLAFGEGNPGSRIQNVMNYKKPAFWVVLAAAAGRVVAGCCLFTNPRQVAAKTDVDDGQISMGAEESAGADDVPNPETAATAAFRISDFYSTNLGDRCNLYTIDENGVLWGCGENQYGQLGQGSADADFHEEKVKIAENVVHLDYSPWGFMVFLTEDHRLYGLGCIGSAVVTQVSYNGPFVAGMAPQRELESTPEYRGRNQMYVITPVLLAEDVTYARCGRCDIVCLKEDGGVWSLGVDWENRGVNGELVPIPMTKKLLDNAVLVTGGPYNHAALQADGNLWTWGANYAGNCGVEGENFIENPTRVAEDVAMVWTGTLEYNVDCREITDFDEFSGRGLENTIIRKHDGTYLACGEGLGEEKVLKRYWEASNYPVVCTSEFVPWTVPQAGDRAEESASLRLQVFTPDEVQAVRMSGEPDGTEAGAGGDIRKLRGMLPGASEGVWYIVMMDGVEYYNGVYDYAPEQTETFGYAYVREGYSLANGISIGMTKGEIARRWPAMAMLDTENNILNDVVGCMGWNFMSYPHSSAGMDDAWEYADGQDYYWHGQFDAIMLAEVEQEPDTLPLYLALMIKDDRVAAITFYCPTAG